MADFIDPRTTAEKIEAAKDSLGAGIKGARDIYGPTELEKAVTGKDFSWGGAILDTLSFIPGRKLVGTGVKSGYKIAKTGAKKGIDAIATGYDTAKAGGQKMLQAVDKAIDVPFNKMGQAAKEGAIGTYDKATGAYKAAESAIKTGADNTVKKTGDIYNATKTTINKNISDLSKKAGNIFDVSKEEVDKFKNFNGSSYNEIEQTIKNIRKDPGLNNHPHIGMNDLDIQEWKSKDPSGYKKAFEDFNLRKKEDLEYADELEDFIRGASGASKSNSLINNGVLDLSKYKETGGVLTGLKNTAVEWAKASLAKAGEGTVRKGTVATLKGLQDGYEGLAKITGSKLIANIIKNNPKSTAIGLTAVVTRESLQALGFRESEIEEIKKELAQDEALTGAGTTSPTNNNGITSSQKDVNPTYANKESEETINGTNKATAEITAKIREQLQSGAITKQEAREALITVKEFANFNFDRSIADNLKMKGLDGSFKERGTLATKLGIEGYQGTYNQNIQMLNSIRYMDHKEIQELLSK